jgi:3-hydroxyisobutyrate dehydrogenase-like beta-hydroxyacid dehydrogenase
MSTFTNRLSTVLSEQERLAIALGEARNNGSHIPMTALVDLFYSEVQAIGGSRWDTSSLFARLKKMSAK